MYPLYTVPAETYTYVAADMAHRGGTRALPPRFVVLHATAGTNSLAWLTTDPASAVSAHFLIDRAGGVRRLVPDDGIAWHAGPAVLYPYAPYRAVNVNDVSIGIELENTNTGVQSYPVSQRQALANLIARLEGKYGHLPVIGHWQIQKNKSDPVAFPWDDYRARLKLLRLTPSLIT